MIKFPISSSKVNMQNKKIDYQILALLTLYSYYNYKEHYDEDEDEELYRYIYRKNILEDMSEFTEIVGKKPDTILKIIKRIVAQNTNLITITKTTNGLVYNINYTDLNGRQFITVDQNTLEVLVKEDSNTIKTYVLLKYMCREKGRTISREYIADSIGLSSNSSSSLQVISNVTNKLEDLKLISKEVVYDTSDVTSNGNILTKKLIKYTLL